MNKKNFAFLSILIISVLFISCSNTKNTRIKLQNFEYSLTGNPNDYKPGINSSRETKNLRHFVPKNRGYLWLKTTFTIPPELEKEELGVYLGIIKIASETYINGKCIGTSGYFPPYEFSEGEITKSYNFTKDELNYNNEPNELVVKLWVDYQGQISHLAFVGTQDDVFQFSKAHSLLNSKLTFIFSFISLLIAFIYFVLYIIIKTDKSYLSFSKLSLFTCLALFYSGFGEFPSIISAEFFSYLTFTKIFSVLFCLLICHNSVSFVRDFLHEEESKTQYLVRFLLILYSVVVLFVPQTLSGFYKVLPIIFIVIFIHILFITKFISKTLYTKRANAYLILASLIPFGLSIVIETFYVISQHYFYYLIILIGWHLTLYIFLTILLYRLAKQGNQIEYLNKNLKRIIDDRTLELKNANDELESINYKLKFQNDVAKREINLASFVQQSFYRNYIPEFNEWEVGYYFKPLEGVSGDLYDIYSTNNDLDGFGIFDVSGHGISSGLVTMLVKNIIQQEFYMGTEMDLTDVIDIINNRITDEKGSIENYLTGILARLRPEHRIEFVNAGHPYPVFYSTKNKTAISLEETNPNRCGALGISDLAVTFTLNTIHFHSGDSILLYTDAITETENEYGEQFGIDRLAKLFENVQKLSIKKQCEKIVEEVTSFAKDEVIKDDTTILIVRRK